MKELSIAAVGDMAFVGRYNEIGNSGSLADVTTFFSKFDLVIGNLESPLTGKGQSIPGKCTLRGKPDWAYRLKNAGVSVLSLANNHLMDHGPEGLSDTIDNLNKAGVQWLGAGNNEKEARAPLFIEKKEKKIALISRTSVFVASPSYAEEKTPGVARFDLQESLAAISACRLHADIVIFLLHWGLEHYRYPAPSQRLIAKQIIEAGADFIIGHHPHVLQGVESIGRGTVAYSLGNFLFDDFSWRFTNQDDNIQEQVIRLSPKQRQAGIFIIKTDNEKGCSFEFQPTRIDTNTDITFDESYRRKNEMKRLSRFFNWRAYGFFWRFHALEREFSLRILPLVKGKLRWEKIKKIRPKHFVQLYSTLRRSAGITRGKNTNPYD